MGLTHGLPDELEKLYGLARINRSLDNQIMEATNKALSAGYSVDRITEVLTTKSYPVPGANEQWLKGWYSAEAGDPCPDDEAGHVLIAGWLAYDRRNA